MVSSAPNPPKELACPVEVGTATMGTSVRPLITVASAASSPSDGAAANSLITGATDEHASVLFEVIFRKNNDLRGNITG